MSETLLMVLALVIAIILISLCIGITISEEKKKSKSREPENAYLISLMGTNFKNPNGAFIQEVIDMMNEGDDVRLQCANYKGNKSVRVDSYYGTIGFLPRDFAYTVYNLIHSGTLGDTKIEKINLSRTGKVKNVIIKVWIDEKVRTNPTIL